MTTPVPDHQRVRDAFVRALDLPPLARESFARGVLDDRPDLAARVSALLADADDVSTAHAYDEDADQGFADRVWAEPLLAQDRLGDFRILGLIGRGGMAVVLHAEHVPTGCEVALKLLPMGTASPALRQRLAREGEILQGLRHPGLARWRASGTLSTPEGLRPYLATDYFAGLPLLQWVREERPDVERRLRVLERVADAVGHAHEHGIVHRDLKPGNVLVGRDDDVCVLDFGVAKILEESGAHERTLTREGQIVGTLRFMSPEQARGDLASIGPATDVHALGLLVFETMTGEPPYRVPSIVGEALPVIVNARPRRASDVDPSLPRELDRLCAHALARDPRERTPDAQRLAEDLRAVRDGRRIAGPGGGWRRRVRPVMRSLAAATILFAFVALGRGLATPPVDRAVEVESMRSEIERAQGLIHVADHTREGLQRAIGLLGAAGRRLDRVPDLGAGIEWRRLVQWRTGEAHYFLGEMSRDPRHYSDALMEWKIAADLDHSRSTLQGLVPTEALGLLDDIHAVTPAQGAQGMGLAFARLAGSRDPWQTWKQSLRARGEALDWLASQQSGTGSRDELAPLHREVAQGLARNEYGESLVMFGAVADSLPMIDEGLRMFELVEDYAMLAVAPVAQASLRFNRGRALVLRSELRGDASDLDGAQAWLERSLEHRSAVRSVQAHLESQTWLVAVDVLRARFASDDDDAVRAHARALRRGDEELETHAARAHPLDVARLELELARADVDLALRGHLERVPTALQRLDRVVAVLNREDRPVEFSVVELERARLARAQSRDPERDVADCEARARRHLDRAAGVFPRSQHPRMHRWIDAERRAWSSETGRDAALVRDLR